jgi:hypothetical protein
MSSLVFSLVVLYCDVRTRLKMRAVDRDIQVSFHDCVLQDAPDYIPARRLFRRWNTNRRKPRVHRNSWSRGRRDPERIIFVC